MAWNGAENRSVSFQLYVHVYWGLKKCWKATNLIGGEIQIDAAKEEAQF